MFFISISVLRLQIYDTLFYFPKKIDIYKKINFLKKRKMKVKLLKDYTIQQIKQMMHWMNHLPRKILKYKTPTESILFHFNQIQGTNGSLVTS